MDLIRSNFGLKLLAFGLALVGWAYVRFAGNPIFGTAQFSQQLSVPITAANLPLGLVAHFTDREAIVTLAGKRGEPEVKPDEIKAVLDLSGKGAGIYNVPVQLVAPDVAVQSLSPASVTLTIESLQQRSFTVGVHYLGAPRDVVVSGTQLRPASAIVRGPTSALGEISTVEADVALPDQAKSLDEMVRPVPKDASGNEVTGLSVSPDLVRVQLRLVPATAK